MRPNAVVLSQDMKNNYSKKKKKEKKEISQPICYKYNYFKTTLVCNSVSYFDQCTTMKGIKQV